MPRKSFQNWLNSPYYHILYSQRNDSEAEFFLDNVCAFLKPSVQARILETGCSRGSRSVYLNKKGYDVTGTDSSYSNIKFAKQFEGEKLHFFQHDSRHLFYINYFDFVFNLFAGLGHLETEKDVINALKSSRKSLSHNGILVLDYINSEKIKLNLSHQEIKQVDGIEFNISKRISEGKILKTIAFEHKNVDYTFKEVFKSFLWADFERLFKLSGFSILNIFGDYSLNDYNATNSDRLIFICKKTDA